jgi:hypothetical protein
MWLTPRPRTNRAVKCVQRDQGALRGKGIACIDVGDRTADHQLLAARQQPGRQRHRLVASRFRVPQVRVAVVLDRAHKIAQLRSVEFIGAVPHAEASEFHVDCLRLKVRVSRYRAAKGTKPCELARFRRCGGRPPRTLMDWIQHDHRYLALGLELIVGVGRPKFERLFPKSEAFLALRRPGPRIYLLGPNLYFNVGFARMLRYQPGCWGAPPFEAITKQLSPSIP